MTCMRRINPRRVTRFLTRHCLQRSRKCLGSIETRHEDLSNEEKEVAEERTDVLVIGSGAAGAAVTKRLTDLGARVVCLEQGNWLKPGDYPSTFSQAFRRDRQEYDTSPNIRRRLEDYPVTTAGANPPLVDMFNAVGGTTIHWARCFPRLHPSDFRVKTLDG